MTIVDCHSTPSAPAKTRPAASEMLADTLVEWQRRGAGDLWIFAYGSLIWRPDFPYVECRPAVIHGRHRALSMMSRINRGSPERPGLVFALIDGGSCRGVAYRIDAALVPAEMVRLWDREMASAVYDPRWLPCRTVSGRVDALAFTLGRASPARVAPPCDAELLEILRHASGRFGTTLAYVADTAKSLRERGIHDRDVERVMSLAREHGLVA